MAEPFSGRLRLWGDDPAEEPAAEAPQAKAPAMASLQLAEEGAIQTFIRTETGREEFMVGVVGVLQFEVLEHRLKTEYGVNMLMDRLPFRYVRWVTKSPKPVEDLKLTSTSGRGWDSEDREVLLFENEWSIRLAEENNKGLELAETAIRTVYE